MRAIFRSGARRAPGRLEEDRPASPLDEPGRGRPVAARVESRINLLGLLAASSLALVAYLVALVLDVSPPPNLSVVFFTIAPATAIPAAVLLAVRARAEQDEALQGVTAGLTVACVGMLLQLAAYRGVSPGGGIFATSQSGSALLYLFWHVAFLGGVFGATFGRPRTIRRRVGLVVGIAVGLVFATAVPGSWNLVSADGDYSHLLTGLMIAVVVVTLLVTLRWVRLSGLRPTATRGWITIALVLTLYDVGLNAVGHQRLSDIWWASLTLRGAAFAVLLGGLIVNTARQLHRLERYASTELARAEGEVSSWAEVTERLLHATSALSGAVTTEDVAMLMSAAAAGAVEVDDAAVYLLDRETPGRLRVLGAIGDTPHHLWAAQMAGTLYTDVMQMHSPVFLESSARIDAFYPSGTGSGASRQVAAAAALPLVAGDKSLGSLVLTSPRPRPFRRLERELLAALARVGAQALDRAMLYEQQSSLAGMLQGALLPQSLPYRSDVDLAAVYLPATADVEVGGDWYDVLEVGASTLLLVVGDVMGKGVPAATLMGEMRSAVRTLAAVDPNPASIISGLDQLALSFDLDSIVTLAIVRLNVETGDGLVANAGHLPPMIFLPGGRVLPASENASPPIGVPVTGPRATQAVHVPPGGSVLLLTDGLVEERRGDLDEGLAALASRGSELLAAAEASLSSVVDGLVHTREHREDDVTVLLARRPAEPARATDGSLLPETLLRVELDRDLAAVGAARRMVRDTVAQLSGTMPRALGPETVDALLLVTSELVTNGLRHGEPPVSLHLDRRGSRLRLTVTDEGTRIPRPRVAEPDSPGGRGLFLVSALSTAWKIEPHGSDRDDAPGTAVWAEFAL